jgi:hypothetical protein
VFQLLIRIKIIRRSYSVSTNFDQLQSITRGTTSTSTMGREIGKAVTAYRFLLPTERCARVGVSG